MFASQGDDEDVEFREVGELLQLRAGFKRKQVKRDARVVVEQEVLGFQKIVRGIGMSKVVTNQVL